MKVPRTFRARKASCRTRIHSFEKLIFEHDIFNLGKTKGITKFYGVEPWRYEDIKGIVEPEIGSKSFGTFEKQAPGPFFQHSARLCSGTPAHRHYERFRSTSRGYFLKNKGRKGSPILGSNDRPPTFNGRLERFLRCRNKTKKKKKDSRKKTNSQWTVVGKKCPFNVEKSKLRRTIPLSNHDLLSWCKYLNIPVKSVLSFRVGMDRVK